MSIFISYNRKNDRAVESVVAALRSTGHPVWFDRNLVAGQIWWSEICEQIEHADAVVLALSPEFLDSPACTTEWRYAHALGTPLLPIIVAPLNLDLLPPELATTHVLDFGRPAERASLSSAVAALPPPSRPHPTPARPPVPRSIYVDMRDRIRGGALNRTEQLALTAEFVLGLTAGDPQEQRSARELLADAQQSQYLLDEPARVMRWVLARVDHEPQPARSTPWLPILGLTVGALGLTNLLWLGGVYPGVAGLINPGDSGDVGFSPVNLVLAVLGAVLCLVGLRRRAAGAGPALAVCAVSMLFAFLDALHVQAFTQLFDG